MYVFELVGEDDALATYEAAAWARDLTQPAPGVALAETVSDQVTQLGWTRSIAEGVYHGDRGIEAIAAALSTAEIGREGTAAVRARAIRKSSADTQRAERELGAILAESGLSIDLDTPEHVFRVLFSGGMAFAGWVIAEPGGDVGRRRPTDRPFFQPGSMAPRLARALVNIAGVRPGVRMLDPMCGTGGIVLEGAFVGGNILGIDVQARMVRGTRTNYQNADPPGSVAVAQGDATRLPVCAGEIDAVVCDMPYGRQSPIAGEQMVADALREARRVTNRAVVVTDHPIPETLAEAGWSIRRSFERRVHRSLTRYLYHLGEPVPKV